MFLFGTEPRQRHRGHSVVTTVSMLSTCGHDPSGNCWVDIVRSCRNLCPLEVDSLPLPGLAQQLSFPPCPHTDGMSIFRLGLEGNIGPFEAIEFVFNDLPMALVLHCVTVRSFV
jgi:hypothetical protein